MHFIDDEHIDRIDVYTPNDHRNPNHHAGAIITDNKEKLFETGLDYTELSINDLKEIIKQMES